MADIKPCPFCGSKGITNRKYDGCYVIECSNNRCPASYMLGWDYDSEEEAVEAWNRRCENE